MIRDSKCAFCYTILFYYIVFLNNICTSILTCYINVISDLINRRPVEGEVITCIMYTSGPMFRIM